MLSGSEEVSTRWLLMNRHSLSSPHLHTLQDVFESTSHHRPIPSLTAPCRDQLSTTTSDDVFLSPAHSPGHTEPTLTHTDAASSVTEGGSSSALTEGGVESGQLSSGLTGLTSAPTESGPSSNLTEGRRSSGLTGSSSIPTSNLSGLSSSGARRSSGLTGSSSIPTEGGLSSNLTEVSGLTEGGLSSGVTEGRRSSGLTGSSSVPTEGGLSSDVRARGKVQSKTSALDRVPPTATLQHVIFL